jgi:hypothetical protein
MTRAAGTAALALLAPLAFLGVTYIVGAVLVHERHLQASMA